MKNLKILPWTFEIFIVVEGSRRIHESDFLKKKDFKNIFSKYLNLMNELGGIEGRSSRVILLKRII